MSETRITSYLGIMTGQVPAKHYFAMWRTFPASCDWSWHESQPVGVTRTYLGLEVYEGAYQYRGMRIVPGLGRQHVRGAHAGRVRARGEMGATVVGTQPPAARARAA